METVHVEMSTIAKIRVAKSGIYNKFNTIEDCVCHLIGVQAQYNQFAMLSIYNRTEKCILADIEELGSTQKIIAVWGQRVTLHIYNIDDWSMINTIYSGRENWLKNRIEKLGINMVDVLKIIDELGRKEKYVKKSDIKEALNHEKNNELMDWGGVLIEAGLNNLLIGVVSTGGEKKYMHEVWFVHNQGYDVENSMETLVCRYFQNYGPATIHDFMHWSGLNRYEFIACFEQMKSRMIALEVNNECYYMVKSDYDKYKGEKMSHAKKIIMLGKFDPLLVSYKNKEWIVDKEFIKTIWGKGGQIEAVIIINDRIVGTWRYKANKKNMDFNIKLFLPLSSEQEKAIGLKSKRIATFYGKELGEIHIKIQDQL